MSRHIIFPLWVRFFSLLVLCRCMPLSRSTYHNSEYFACEPVRARSFLFALCPPCHAVWLHQIRGTYSCRSCLNSTLYAMPVIWWIITATVAGTKQKSTRSQDYVLCHSLSFICSSFIMGQHACIIFGLRSFVSFYTLSLCEQKSIGKWVCAVCTQCGEYTIGIPLYYWIVFTFVTANSNKIQHNSHCIYFVVRYWTPLRFINAISLSLALFFNCFTVKCVWDLAVA